MLLEVRFHGRGGQGAVTAATLLVTAALYDGYTGQAIPYFGAERRGAPVTSFARISDEKIRIHSQIYNPDVVVVLDEYVAEIVNVTSGLKPEGILIMNTKKEPRELAEKFDVGRKIATVDATSIALSLNLVLAGWPIVNTAILGSISRTLNIPTLDSIVKAVKEYFRGEAGELNAKAVIEAYNKTRIFEV